MEFLMFLGCVAVIVLDVFIAKEFQRIAEKKGHSETRYFWWCFWLGIVGYFMVAALPDLNARPRSYGNMSWSANPGRASSAPADDDLPEI